MASTIRVPRPIITPSLCKQIRDFWFTDLPAGSAVATEAAQRRWFGQDPTKRDQFDGLCRARAGAALDILGPSNIVLPSVPASSTSAEERAADASVASALLHDAGCGGNDGPRTEADIAHNALGLVLLLDQMPRNIFRGEESRLVFTHYDRLARAVTHELLKSEPRPDLHPSLRLSPARRMWFYLPLMHSEFVDDHDLCVASLGEMRGDIADAKEEGWEEAVKAVDGVLSFEGRHAALVKRFGRYPHRNIPLGRAPTKEEEVFLENGGDTFG